MDGGVGGSDVLPALWPWDLLYSKGWRLAAVGGGWWLVVPGDYPAGLSLTKKTSC